MRTTAAVGGSRPTSRQPVNVVQVVRCVLAAVCVTASSLASTACAAPAITGTSGTLSHGSTLTITGTGFGTKPVAAPLKYDDFEGGTYGNIVGNGWSVSCSGKVLGCNPDYSNRQVRTNSTMSSRARFWGLNGDVDANWESSIWLQVAYINHVYLDFWTYMWATPVAANAVSGNHKLFRIHAVNDSPNLYFNIYCDDGVRSHLSQDDTYRHGSDTTGHFHRYFNSTPPGYRNNWKHLQGYFEKSSVVTTPPVGYDGTARFWVDSRNYVDDRDWNNTDTTASNWNRIYIGNFSAPPCDAGPDCLGCGTPRDTIYTYFDNVYVDTTQAHVEIGDGTTYNTCTVREIQPPTSWTATSINITLNRGAWADFSAKYAYVTDRYGAVNDSGFPLYRTNGGPGGCPFVLTETEAGFSVENSILGRSEDGGRGRFVSDAYPLLARADARGKIRLRVAELEADTDEIDELSLGRVDVPDGRRLATDSSGRPVLVHPLEIPIRSAQWSGRESPFRSPVAPGNAYRGEAGDSAEFELQPGQSLAVNSRLGVGVQLFAKQHAPSLQGGAAGVTIRVSPDAEGERWVTLGSVIPREFWSTDVLPSTEPSGQAVRRIRVIWHTPHTLGWIGIVETAQVEPQVVPCLSARHSDGESVLEELKARDGRITTISPKEFVELEFEAGEASAGTQYVLLANGRYYRTTTQNSEAVPAAYSLAQNRPNPFNPETSIEFALSAPSAVALRVFDVTGRLVATLVDGPMPAGSHIARWNARDDQGQPVSSGVYYYELRVEKSVERRRMVLLR